MGTFVAFLHESRELSMSIANSLRIVSSARVALTIFGLLAVSRARAATIVVNDVSDTLHGAGCAATGTGLCSLRDAITFANANAGADAITFGIGSGVQSIALTSALPSITDTVTIDGTTQPGFAGAPVIELNGAGAAGAVAGLQINALGCAIKGLVINRFGASAIVLNSRNNVVSGNYIGTNVTGAIALGGNPQAVLINSTSRGNTIGGTTVAERNVISGNVLEGIAIYSGGTAANVVQGNYIGLSASGTAALPNTGNGILISNSQGNTIGGTAAGAGNVISGNGRAGIVLTSVASTANLIQGNFIGTNAAGAAVLGNQTDGVEIEGGANTNTIGGTIPGARNIISGNSPYGILLDAGSGNLIQGNFIGTNVSGTAALGIQQDGIHIHSDSNTIGGTTASARNVISGNTQSGIRVESSTANANLIEGNFIGTDVTGMAAVGNGGAGVHLAGASNTIGGIVSGAGNVISGNLGPGIHIGSVSGDTGANNLVQGNFIGTDLTGTAALGNSGDGVEIGLSSVASNTTIGGTAAGAGNTIAYNGGTGVNVFSGTGHAILGNSLFSNGGLGIDLNGDGVTPNDACDGDNGANKLQNFPILTTAFSTGGTTTIQGTLNSVASGTYRIEFFSNTYCDPSAFGEGRTFLGSATVTTDVSCNGSFNVTLPVAVSSQARLTATATDAANNTSEFCSCISLETRYYTIAPCRVADTRNPTGPYGGPALAANADRTFVIAGKCGVPASAVAVAFNFTVTQPTAQGDLRTVPAGGTLPLVSTMNWRPGQTRANNAILSLGPAGDITTHVDQASGSVHLIIDVNGYFQ
jgi:hypothetical protein